MVKCPDCETEGEESYENAEIIYCETNYIRIRYTRLIRCPIHGIFKQHNQIKDVKLP